jgi:hypothetical protein
MKITAKQPQEQPTELDAWIELIFGISQPPKALEAPKFLEVPTEEPKFCPMCGHSNVIALGTWSARSDDPTDKDNTATLTEYQCECAAAFWL